MTEIKVDDVVIKSYAYENNKEIKNVNAYETMVVKAGAFSKCDSLENVYFGLDITRISNGAFSECKNLKDVWLAIIDEDKYIEIADDAFKACPKDITFHIFATAKNNKYLNRYAKKHDFSVEGMI